MGGKRRKRGRAGPGPNSNGESSDESNSQSDVAVAVGLTTTKEDLELIIQEAVQLAMSKFLHDRGIFETSVHENFQITNERVDKLTDQVDALKGQLAEEKKRVNHLETLLDQQESYTRRDNLVIHGLVEKEGEITPQLVTDFFSDALKTKVESKEVLAHRLGKPGSSKTRPIIVRFRDRKVRDTILRSRRKLKGSGVFISEDATQRQRELLKAVRESGKCPLAWTYNGRVMAKLPDGSIREVQQVDNKNVIYKKPHK